MNRVPRISVIMPAYNAARYLRQAVTSILDQTFPDFEFIIIDDGSTDASAEILSEFASVDHRVRVLSRTNTGIVGALNDGIAIARGELLARMDADDIAISSRFERQIAYLDTHPKCVAVGSSVFIMDEDGNEIVLDSEPTEHEQIEEKLLNGQGSLCHPTVVMRTEIVRRVGAYREQYRLAQDMDLFLRLGELGRLANIREPLLRYRWHLASITHRKNILEGARTRAAMVQEACRRRNIPERVLPVPSVLLAEKSEKDLIIEHYHRWSYAAAKAGRFDIARKYALAAWRLQPSRKKNWWALCNSLAGIDLTARLTSCFQQMRFWRRAQ